MSVKFVDRRLGGQTDPEAVAEQEQDRQARRRAVREAAAKRDLELQPARLAEADIKASEARCDRLADAHLQTSLPWQEELQQLEQQAITRIGQREPPDEIEDNRRVELTKLIASATAELEKAIAEERELQAKRRRTARTTRQGHPPSDTILAALAKPPLANGRLLGELFVAQQRVQWLVSRRSAAEKTHKICAYNAAEIAAGRMAGILSVWEGKAASWALELQRVAEEIAAAQAESKRIHQEMLDE